MLLWSSVAFANDYRVVIDERGNAVRSSYGSCVITRWPVPRNICHPQEPKPIPQAVAPAPVPPQPRLVLSTEERTVYFPFDRAHLTPNARKRLEHLVWKVRQSGQIYDGRVVGYADRIGSETYNRRLSQRRAETVSNYLQKNGLSVRGVAVRYRGENDPVTNCGKLPRKELIRCLARDRRVEVELELRRLQRPYR